MKLSIYSWHLELMTQHIFIMQLWMLSRIQGSNLLKIVHIGMFCGQATLNMKKLGNLISIKRSIIIQVQFSLVERICFGKICIDWNKNMVESMISLLWLICFQKITIGFSKIEKLRKIMSFIYLNQWLQVVEEVLKL